MTVSSPGSQTPVWRASSMTANGMIASF